MPKKINDQYDIGEAFSAIEDELIASMIRNMKRHKQEEIDEDKQWSMWQAEQLKALEKYRKQNQKKFGPQFAQINSKIEALIREARNEGEMDQEIAILRRANDQYRKVIYNAQVYANTGAGTYEKAVDMAKKNMLAAGLTCVEYVNGARHTLSDYADMAIRTASKRAYLQGEGTKRQEWNIPTVIVNKRGNPCPKCLPFCGKVLIDDVWSGGTKDGKSPVTGLKYPLISKAISAGLYHPRCRDSHTTYFEDISKPPDNKYTVDELDQIAEDYRKEQKQQYAKRQEEKFGRLAKYSLDPENQEMYGRKEKGWRHVRFKTGNMTSKEYAESKRPLANFQAVPENRVVDVMRKDSEEWIESLTPEERYAIQKYTYNSGDKKPNRFFERLNAMLRGDIPEDEKLKAYADIISGALRKNKLKHDVICYRKMEFNPYESHPVGKIFTADQFISTSVTEHGTLKKDYKLIFFVPKGAKGAYIENISNYPEQREMLLDKNCQLRVISKHKKEMLLEVIV